MYRVSSANVVVGCRATLVAYEWRKCFSSVLKFRLSPDKEILSHYVLRLHVR